MEVSRPKVRFRFYFVCDQKEYYFTRREAEVVVILMQGKTVAHAAERLSLSRRTVEYYVNNMKLKLGCHTKHEMLKKISRADLSNFDVL